MSYQFTVTDIAGKAHSLTGDDGSTLMEILRDAGLVEGVCGGVCACATCHVVIGADWFQILGAQSEEEKMLLEELPNMKEGSRLACQVNITSALDGAEMVILEE